MCFFIAYRKMALKVKACLFESGIWFADFVVSRFFCVSSLMNVKWRVEGKKRKKRDVTAGKVELNTPVKRNTGCICASQTLPFLSLFFCILIVFLYKYLI